MRTKPEKLEEELAKSLNLVNDAEETVELARKTEKLASSVVVKLQKEEYRAERSFNIASRALVKALNKAQGVDDAHIAANKALVLAKTLQKEVYRAERAFKEAGEVLAKALKKAKSADAAYRAAKEAFDTAAKNESKKSKAYEQ